MSQILIRFLIDGAVVCVFAIVGDLLKPKSFAGLFGAAPSVALATLWLTVATEGASYASTEAHFMMAGAIAFMAYASCVRLPPFTDAIRVVLITNLAILVNAPRAARRNPIPAPAR